MMYMHVIHLRLQYVVYAQTCAYADVDTHYITQQCITLEYALRLTAMYYLYIQNTHTDTLHAHDDADDEEHYVEVV